MLRLSNKSTPAQYRAILAGTLAVAGCQERKEPPRPNYGYDPVYSLIETTGVDETESSEQDSYDERDTGCHGPESGSDGYTSTDGDGEESYESSESESSGEPQFVADFGELEIDCPEGEAIGECSLHQPEGKTCEVACEIPEPCEPIYCQYDYGYDSRCETVVNPDAVDCVLSSLESGKPTTFTISYARNQFHGPGATLEVWRLSSDWAMATSTVKRWDDGSDLQPTSKLSGYRVDAENIWKCRLTETYEQRFWCIYRLFEQEECPPEDVLICPIVDGG